MQSARLDFYMYQVFLKKTGTYNKLKVLVLVVLAPIVRYLCALL